MRHPATASAWNPGRRLRPTLAAKSGPSSSGKRAKGCRSIGTSTRGKVRFTRSKPNSMAGVTHARTLPWRLRPPTRPNFRTGESSGSSGRFWWRSGSARSRFAGISTASNDFPSSVAVLPFLDLSPQKDSEYFSDGLTEEIIDALSRVPNLRLVARTSAFAFKGKNTDIRDIGKQLNVNAVIEGERPQIRQSPPHYGATQSSCRRLSHVVANL